MKNPPRIPSHVEGRPEGELALCGEGPSTLTGSQVRDAWRKAIKRDQTPKPDAE